MKQWVDELLNPISGASDNRPFFTLRAPDGTIVAEHVELVLENTFVRQGTPVDAINLNETEGEIASAQSTANSALTIANAALPGTGGTVSGNLNVTGNLLKGGNAVWHKNGFGDFVVRITASGGALSAGANVPFDKAYVETPPTAPGSVSITSDHKISVPWGGVYLVLLSLPLRILTDADEGIGYEMSLNADGATLCSAQDGIFIHDPSAHYHYRTVTMSAVYRTSGAHTVFVPVHSLESYVAVTSLNALILVRIGS